MTETKICQLHALTSKLHGGIRFEKSSIPGRVNFKWNLTLRITPIKRSSSTAYILAIFIKAWRIPGTEAGIQMHADGDSPKRSRNWSSFRRGILRATLVFQWPWRGKHSKFAAVIFCEFKSEVNVDKVHFTSPWRPKIERSRRAIATYRRFWQIKPTKLVFRSRTTASKSERRRTTRLRSSYRKSWSKNAGECSTSKDAFLKLINETSRAVQTVFDKINPASASA